MKKAQVPVTVYFRIFEIILLVLVIGIIYLEVKNVTDNGIYQKKFLSRDLALLMDSFANARGNLYYNYDPHEEIAVMRRFTFDFKNRRVVVDDEAWPYATNENVRFQEPPPFKNPQHLTFRKVANTLSIEPPVTVPSEFNGYLMDCPGTKTAVKEVLIDPGHGYNFVTTQGEQGVVGAFKDTQGKSVPESQLALTVGTSLQQHLKQTSGLAEEKISSTRTLKVEFLTLPAVGPLPFLAEEAKSTKERIAVINTHPDAIVISLHAGKTNPRQNVVKAFVNNDFTDKDAKTATYHIACTLLNAIATRYPLDITGTAIIPVDLDQVGPDDPKQVLLKDRIAVQLELGNIDFEKNKLFEKPGTLAEAIAAGVES